MFNFAAPPDISMAKVHSHCAIEFSVVDSVRGVPSFPRPWLLEHFLIAAACVRPDAV